MSTEDKEPKEDHKSSPEDLTADQRKSQKIKNGLQWLKDFIFGKDTGPTKKDVNRLSERKKFSDYMPWIAYDEKTEIYYNQDNTCGFIFECAPLAFAGDKTIFTLEGLFRLGLPYGSVMQFILYADKYIDSYLQAYEDGKTRDLDIIKENTKNFTEYLRAGTDGMEVFSRTPLRNFRLFVTVKMYSKDITENALGDLFNSTREILRGANLVPKPLPPDRFLDWMRKLFNDMPSENNTIYDENIPLNKQVILADTVIKKSLSELKIGKRYFRCTTVKNFPKVVNSFQTNELYGGVWGMISDANQITTPFLYSLNIIFHNLKTQLHTKCNFVLQQQAVGSFAPSLMRKKDEYMRAVDDVEKGTQFVKIIPSMWVWSDNPATTSESIIRTKRLWESQGYIMQEDKGILPILLIASLPFGLYEQGDTINNLERDFIVQAPTVSSLLPIQADFAGGGFPVLMFAGRKGQMCSLDVFDKHANNHNIFIAASSGSGKSFLVNNLVCNYYGSDALIRIVDIGGSYKKMTNMFGARFLDFRSDSDMCLNPFTTVIDPAQELNIIAALVLQMVYSSTDVIPDATAETAMTLIKTAVQWAWETKGTDACIDTVHEYLSKFPLYANDIDLDNSAAVSTFTILAQNLAFNLLEFTSDRLYGKWFNGPATFDISRDEFVVLELEHLKPQKELFKVVTLQVINAVTKDLYLTEERGRKRFIIFDEAWQFLREGQQMKQVIEEGYRRARKYGGSFTVITQSVLDVKQFGAVGDVIRANSAYKFYLESSDFDRARSEGLLELDEFGMRILKSVRSNKPKYSEIFMDTPHGMGVARLAVDPFSYYMYTSDASEIAELENIMASTGMSYAEAIKKMIKIHHREMHSRKPLLEKIKEALDMQGIPFAVAAREIDRLHAEQGY
ncbi:MAG: Protein TraC [Syntrophus sp. SKADARSKE-3]|nr:Protein TraC [Syntrophus sp. SKADARSKE-3]